MDAEKEILRVLQELQRTALLKMAGISNGLG